MFSYSLCEADGGRRRGQICLEEENSCTALLKRERQMRDEREAQLQTGVCGTYYMHQISPRIITRSPLLERNKALQSPRDESEKNYTSHSSSGPMSESQRRVNMPLREPRRCSACDGGPPRINTRLLLTLSLTELGFWFLGISGFSRYMQTMWFCCVHPTKI